MISANSNRAVSTLFRAFGGQESQPDADTAVRTEQPAMHRGETYALATLVPLTAAVVVFQGLNGYFGLTVSLLLALPLGWLSLHLLPWLLAARSPRGQWQLWFFSALAWAIFYVNGDGLVGFVATLWISIAVMSGAGSFLLGWRKLMEWQGVWGVRLRLALVMGLHGLALAVGYQFGGLVGLLVGAGIAGGLCWAILNPHSQWLGIVYQSTASADLLITIDDGPDPHDTPKLLDLLDRHQARAIFFMIGEKVEKFPELAREVIRRGHEIGNHTMTHPQASFWCAGPSRTRREIADCQRVIERVTGVKPRWFRAPVGHRNLFTHPIASDFGLRVMSWSRRGFDGVEQDFAKVLNRLSANLQSGDIVLVHEATPIAAEVLAGVLMAESKPNGFISRSQ